LPPRSHDEFMRLCALSTSGELTSEEEARLEEHLSYCDVCREAQRGYERVIATALPMLASEISAEPEDAPGSESWSLDEAERKLMKAVEEDGAPKAKHGSRIPKSSKTYLATVAILTAVVAAASTLGYRAGLSHAAVSSTKRDSNSVQRVVSPVAPTPAENRTEFLDKLPEADDGVVANMRARLVAEEAHTSDIRAQFDQLQRELEQKTDDLAQATTDRGQLKQQLAQEQAHAQSLQSSLAEFQSLPPDDSAQLSALQGKVATLTAAVASQNATIAQDTELLQHDRDIRNLMGARNLYIAEIYDVAKNGSTQKPFGRVFYTRDKSLIFYGFDLDRQPGVKNTTVFQAWGRQEAAHNVSLGILYRDDSDGNRWVLKFNDATTLARLDAVFVTVEPPGGSSKPSGKPLLFTYLRLPANHP
jgi:hypothetical protein